MSACYLAGQIGLAHAKIPCDSARHGYICARCAAALLRHCEVNCYEDYAGRAYAALTTREPWLPLVERVARAWWHPLPFLVEDEALPGMRELGDVVLNFSQAYLADEGIGMVGRGWGRIDDHGVAWVTHTGPDGDARTGRVLWVPLVDPWEDVRGYVRRCCETPASMAGAGESCDYPNRWLDDE